LAAGDLTVAIKVKSKGDRAIDACHAAHGQEPARNDFQDSGYLGWHEKETPVKI
jgi:hypothetical protein